MPQNRKIAPRPDLLTLRPYSEEKCDVVGLITKDGLTPKIKPAFKSTIFENQCFHTYLS